MVDYPRRGATGRRRFRRSKRGLCTSWRGCAGAIWREGCWRPQAGQGPTRSTSSPATARNTGPAGEGVEEEAGVRGKTTNLNRREDA